MPTRTVTVLMTVYNGGDYLGSAVESVLKQTFQDFEFLIINDCSRDGSEEVIRAFNDPRIRLVNNEKNLGQTRSLNKGLSLAKGRYIARIDADDLAFPSWLEKNLDLLRSQPLSAVVSCKAVVVDNHNKIQKTLMTPTAYEEMVLRSLTATPINHVGAVYKNDVIALVAGYDESFKIAADFELWSKLIRRGIRLSVTQEPLVAIRVHEHSASMAEKGRADITEISEIMTRNFKALVTSPVSPDDIILLWKLNYETELLSPSEFKYALDLLLKAYQNIKPEFFVTPKAAGIYAAYQKKVFYAKRALGEITRGHIKEARVLAEDYRKTEGVFNIFSVIWLGSFLGKPALQYLPGLYRRWREWSARQKVFGELPSGIIS